MKNKQCFIVSFLLVLSILGSLLLVTNPKPLLAASGILKWTCIDTPGAVASKNDIASPCEVNHIALSLDSRFFYAVDIANANNTDGSKALYKSTDSGVSWSDTISKKLYKTMPPNEQINFRVWNVATAPNNVNIVAVVTNDDTSHWPRNVWVSTNGGTKWNNTNCPAGDHISSIDISPSYSGYDIVVGTRTGTGNGNVYIFKASEQGSWSVQGFNGDILALKFSPDYVNDSSLVVISADTTGTYINIGIHDMAANSTKWDTWSPVEITTSGTNTSPRANQIITADLELPADFSGQSANLRRYYISTDDGGATGNAGIYRFDDSNGYWLMTATPTKRISTIAYYGTYASGKLLAGEVLGDPCSATVMTWFTDAPTTCPIPCWYPAMKAPTGATGTDNCIGSGYGNAQLAWSPDGSLAYAATASTETLIPGASWPLPYLTGEDLDESALSFTRNNGETWNQLALIDTRIDQFIDIAPSADCSTVYLASINPAVNCSGFDSVWRSQTSPIGSIWERILCQPSSDQNCGTSQTDIAILRLAGDKSDGQLVLWGAQGTKKIMWSPDFGDYWTHIKPTLTMQDVAVEDSKTLYVLSPDGYVQKFTFSGTGWTSYSIVPTELSTGYSIATAYTSTTPDNDKGCIIVGGTGAGNHDVAYSTDSGDSFTPITTQLPTRGNTLVVAHSGYKSNGEIFAINSGGMYEWSIYYGGGTWAWPLPEFGEWATQWGGPSWPTPVTSLAISRNGSFYFSDAWGAYVRWASASAGLDPTVSFGTDPTTRLRICGGLVTGEPITVWLIDQHPFNPPLGEIWCYIDTLAWNSPTPKAPITNATVKYDPVSGRASELNLTWQPVSLSRGYRIQIAKDEDFAMLVTDIGATWGGPYYTPPDLDAPALVIPAGGGTVIDGNSDNWTVPALETGHSYYWRVMVQDVSTGDDIQSPWSWREIFTVQTGLRTATKCYGPTLLSPDNGCIGYPAKLTSFSWSPLPGTTMYKFTLATDAAMTDIVVETKVPSNAYECPGILEYNRDYFWRVMALEPMPSNWSPTFCFQTVLAPMPPQPAQTVQVIPHWVWAIIVIGMILDISLLTLVVSRMPRRIHSTGGKKAKKVSY